MMHSQNAQTMLSVRNTEKTRDGVLASVGRGFGMPRLGFHFNMRSTRPRMGGPICIFLGPSCIDWPMDLPSKVLFLAAQFMYFFEENATVCSIFLYKNRNARYNLCFPFNYIIYI